MPDKVSNEDTSAHDIPVEVELEEAAASAASIDGPEDAAEIAVEVEESSVDDEPAEPEGAQRDEAGALEAKLAELEASHKQTYERLVRTTADFDNFRKRSRRDLDDARTESKASVLKEMLPILDNLERALEHSESSGEDSSGIVEGVKLVLRQFQQALSRADVAAVEALGESFDPNLHEAISQQSSADHPPGHVCQVVQKGYTIGKRLLRPAMVVVATAPAAPEQPETSATDVDEDVTDSDPTE